MGNRRHRKRTRSRSRSRVGALGRPTSLPMNFLPHPETSTSSSSLLTFTTGSTGTPNNTRLPSGRDVAGLQAYPSHNYLACGASPCLPPKIRPKLGSTTLNTTPCQHSIPRNAGARSSTAAGIDPESIVRFLFDGSLDFVDAPC